MGSSTRRRTKVWQSGGGSFPQSQSAVFSDLTPLLKLQYFQDYEIKNRYQVYTYVVFRDQESFKRVPKEGQSFHIPAPVIENKPGGLGLDDIRHLLDSTDRDETFQLPSAASLETEASKERLIGARIERSCMSIYRPFNFHLYQCEKHCIS